MRGEIARHLDREDDATLTVYAGGKAVDEKVLENELKLEHVQLARLVVEEEDAAYVQVLIDGEEGIKGRDGSLGVGGEDAAGPATLTPTTLGKKLPSQVPLKPSNCRRWRDWESPWSLPWFPSVTLGPFSPMRQVI